MKMNEYDIGNNYYSQILYDKDYNELNPDERIKVDQFIFDNINPQWKKIIINGIETNYSVSNIDTIRNDNSGKILVPTINDSGYLKINLVVNSKMLTKKIHRLVAIAFIPNPDNKREVNHINCKKTCNWIGNLEWTTSSENKQHAISNGLYDNASFTKQGIDRPNTVYTEDQIHAICKLLEAGKNPKEISETLNVPKNLVGCIKYGGKWKIISSKYNIPKSYKKVSEARLHKAEIISLINDNPFISCDDIITKLNLPDSIRNREFINRMKRASV